MSDANTAMAQALSTAQGDIIEQARERASVGNGASYELFSLNFSRDIRRRAATLPQNEGSQLVAAAVSSGDYLTEDEARDLFSGCCEHGIDWGFCPAGCDSDDDEEETESDEERAQFEAQMCEILEAEEAHYSDLTLTALVENHGWQRLGENAAHIAVEREFEGAPCLSAGYADDPERRRYIALKRGDAVIVDFDGREGSPAEIARQLNERAEQFVRGI